MEAKEKLTYDEFVSKYFTPVHGFRYRYTRNRDGYIFSGEDVEYALNYYNQTNKEP